MSPDAWVTWAWFVVFKSVMCGNLCCFKVLLISPPDLFARHFCNLLLKMFQLKLSIAERCALNQYKCGTTLLSRLKRNHTCLLWLQWKVYLRIYCFVDVHIPQPWQHKPTNRENLLLYFPFFEGAKEATDLELTYTANMFLIWGNFDNCNKFYGHTHYLLFQRRGSTC